MQCLEALPSTGVPSLLWTKHLSSELTKFHSNCSSDKLMLDRVTENVKLNHLDGKVNLLSFDPFSVNNDHSFFNFIYLEGFANSAQYLDGIFRRMPRKGLVAISTVDDPALSCKTPEVAQRLYGGLTGKTLYYKELGARLILSAVARSAARANRGIKVLWCYCFKSCLSMLVQVDKGPAKANECLKNVSPLIHCNICEERVFYPNSIYVIENPYSLLPCSCNSKVPGKTAISIGPVWSGELNDPSFINKMISESSSLPWNSEISEVLNQLLEEGVCSSANPTLEAVEVPPENGEGVIQDLPKKKVRREIQLENNIAPPFYFNLHTNRPKDSKMVKADKVVTFLRNTGFRASRTHFDREAVKTNASVEELLKIIRTGSHTVHE
ncbi:TRMT1-like protein isoform X2 [Neocloeon triangulifer]|nr:TRMT1-like protein isoform X2 [Neocloeon triangulifer]